MKAVKKMFNGNILCEEVTKAQEETSTGFAVANMERFKELRVVSVNGIEDVSVGDILKVSVSAGEEIKIYGDSYITVNVRDIILIL